MNIKKLNEEIEAILEKLSYSNTTDAMLKELRPGLYISRGQSEVSHRHYPDHWQYFGPYEKPTTVEKYMSRFGHDNEKHYEDGKIEEFDVISFNKNKVRVKGQLIKTWEEFLEEDDNIHHSYREEYRILEVL